MTGQNTPFWMLSSYKKGPSFRLLNTRHDFHGAGPMYAVFPPPLRHPPPFDIPRHSPRNRRVDLVTNIGQGLCPINFWLDPDTAFPAIRGTYVRRRGCTTTVLAGRNRWTWQGLKRECSMTLTFNPLMTGLMALEFHTNRVFELDKYIH